MESATSGNLSEECKQGDTSVLDLDISQAVKAFLVNIVIQKTEGIKESKRKLGIKLILN